MRGSLRVEHFTYSEVSGQRVLERSVRGLLSPQGRTVPGVCRRVGRGCCGPALNHQPLDRRSRTCGITPLAVFHANGIVLVPSSCWVRIKTAAFLDGVAASRGRSQVPAYRKDENPGRGAATHRSQGCSGCRTSQPARRSFSCESRMMAASSHTRGERRSPLTALDDASAPSGRGCAPARHLDVLAGTRNSDACPFGRQFRAGSAETSPPYLVCDLVFRATVSASFDAAVLATRRAPKQTVTPRPAAIAPPRGRDSRAAGRDTFRAQ